VNTLHKGDGDDDDGDDNNNNNNRAKITPHTKILTKSEKCRRKMTLCS
jgi:hypothetical protein